MRRWNGWGDDAVDAPLPPAARDAARACSSGRATPPRGRDARGRRGGRPGRAASQPRRRAWTLDPEARVRHARGQSLPDWIAAALRPARRRPRRRRPARRRGRRPRPASPSPRRRGARLIPYGGGTSVVGGVNVRPRTTPGHHGRRSSGMAGLRDLDERSGLATFGAGTTGPAVEAALGAARPDPRPLPAIVGVLDGRRLGRDPLGRASSRSATAASRRCSPAATSRRRPGRWTCRPIPASAAGPDLRQLILGRRAGPGSSPTSSSGRRPIAEARALRSRSSLGGWERALDVRPVARPGAACRSRWSASRRRSRPRRRFALGADARGAAAPARYLALRGAGRRALPRHRRRLTGHGRWSPPRPARSAGSCRRARAASALPGSADAWQRQRFAAPYLRNTLWDAGYAVDTLETATDWSRLGPLAAALGPALRHGLEPTRRAGPRVQPSLARLPERLEPVHDLRLPPRRRPGRDPGALAPAQDRGERGHRRPRRDDQPPARRRARPRPVPRRREGPARDGGAPRRARRARPGRPDGAGRPAGGGPR